MPIATLRFDLNDAYEKDAHSRAIKADKAYGVLWDLAQHLRSIRKYGDRPEQELTAINEIEEKLNELLIESGVDLYEEYK